MSINTGISGLPVIEVITRESRRDKLALMRDDLEAMLEQDFGRDWHDTARLKLYPWAQNARAAWDKLGDAIFHLE